MFLLGILIFKGLTVRRLYKSFGFKGLSLLENENSEKLVRIFPYGILKKNCGIFGGFAKGEMCGPV
jgi:hypothetical protein